jgi:hypothetical protein
MGFRLHPAMATLRDTNTAGQFGCWSGRVGTNHNHFSFQNWIQNKMALTYSNTTIVLAAGVAQQILPADSTRVSLLRSTNTGVATWKFQSQPSSVTDGIVLDPSVAGGGRVFLSGRDVPVDSIWALSAAGGVVAVEVGRAS